jgi:hypothetical protein
MRGKPRNKTGKGIRVHSIKVRVTNFRLKVHHLLVTTKGCRGSNPPEMEEVKMIRYWEGKFICYRFTKGTPMKTAGYIMLCSGRYKEAKWNFMDKMVLPYRRCFKNEV